MSVYKIGKKWRGQISVRNHTVHVGMFKSRKEAREACEHAKRYNSYTFTEDWLSDPDINRKSLWIKIKEWWLAQD